ncbi:MAG TPA: hypothetical protein VM450_17445 [Thermomicrobiales bacterium]|nr:hypothetical protein [Thermomicrobiales bacterium]
MGEDSKPFKATKQIDKHAGLPSREAFLMLLTDDARVHPIPPDQS